VAFDLASAKPVEDAPAAGGFDLASATPVDATPPGVIPGAIPQAQVAKEYAASRPKVGITDVLRDILRTPPEQIMQTKTADVLGETFGDLIRSSTGDAVMKTIQGLMPGMTGSLQQIAKPAAATAGKVSAAVPKMPNFSIPGSGIVNRATGKTADTAAEALRSKFGQVAGQVPVRAGEEANQQTAAAFNQIRDARVAQRAHEMESEAQAAKTAQEGEALLSRGVGTPGSAHARGEPLRGQVGERLNQAYESRAAEAEGNFTKVIESGKAKEAAGQPFAASPQGQDALRKLKSLRGEGSATDPLLQQERAELDKFIAMVEGDKKSGIRPAGVEPLMKQLRIIKDYKEGGPATGTSALPEKFMKQLDSIFEPALYGKDGWLPEGGAAQTAYRLASEKLNPFKTAAGRTLTRGEKFDFKQLAASPEEFGTRFFKDSKSVKDLKDMLGNDQMFTSAAKDWAASKIEPMSAAQAKKWMTANEGQLSAAGIKSDIEKHVKALADHETQAALRESQAAARTKELAASKAEAWKQPRAIEARRAAVTDRFQKLQTEIGSAKPKEIAGKVRTLGSDLVKDGHITQEEYSNILREANELDKHYSDSAATTQTLMKIAKYAGLSGAAAAGLLGAKHAFAGEEARNDRSFDDAEKERKYQEWKARRK